LIGHYPEPSETPQQNGFTDGSNGSLQDKLLNEELFDTVDNARRKRALWQYDYKNVRPHSLLGTKTHRIRNP